MGHTHRLAERANLASLVPQFMKEFWSLRSYPSHCACKLGFMSHIASMAAVRGNSSGFAPVGAQFRSTHWSVVLAAKDAHTPEAAAALEKLCRAYWYPLYAHVRRRGYSQEEAQDLTQDLFQRLLERQFLSFVAGRGPFPIVPDHGSPPFTG